MLSTLLRKRLRRILLTVVAYIAMAISRFEAFSESITRSEDQVILEIGVELRQGSLAHRNVANQLLPPSILGGLGRRFAGSTD